MRLSPPCHWPGPLAGLAVLGLFQLGHGLPPGDDDAPPPVLYEGEIKTDGDFTSGQPPTPGLIEVYKQGLKTGKHTLAPNLIGAVEKYLRDHPEADLDRAPSADTGAKGGPAEDLEPVPGSKPEAGSRPAGKESGQGAASVQGGTAGSGAGPSRQERSQLGPESVGLTQKLAGRMAGWLKPDRAGLEEASAGGPASAAMGGLQGGTAARAGRPGAASSSRGASGQEPMAGGLSAEEYRLFTRDIQNNPRERIFTDIAVFPEGLRYSRSCERVSGQCNPLARESYRRGHRVRFEHAASLADVWKQFVEEAAGAEEASRVPRHPRDQAIGNRLASWLGSGGMFPALLGEGSSAGPVRAPSSMEGLPAARDPRTDAGAYAGAGLGAAEAASERASAVGVSGLRAPGGFGFLLAFFVGGAALLLLRPKGR